MHECTVCGLGRLMDEEAMENILIRLDCGEHAHCDDWDCKDAATWKCERGGCHGEDANCVHCNETCISCDRPPGIEGVY